jgi:hypothetical protein
MVRSSAKEFSGFFFHLKTLTTPKKKKVKKNNVFERITKILSRFETCLMFLTVFHLNSKELKIKNR